MGAESRAAAAGAMALRREQIARDNATILAEMELLLADWIEEQHAARNLVTVPAIQKKARKIHAQLRDAFGYSCHFQADDTWLDSFERAARPREVVADAGQFYEDVDCFTLRVQKAVDDGGYSARQIFNAKELGLCWKARPAQIVQSGGQAERVSLILCANAAGDFRLRPLVVRRADQGQCVSARSVEPHFVIYRSNKSSLVTADIFDAWFVENFCPEVTAYCQHNGLPRRALLVVDSTECHSDRLAHLSKFVQVVFVPWHLTAWLQPFNQGIILKFLAYYTYRLLDQALDSRNSCKFWANYTIEKARGNIAQAWNDLSKPFINRTWSRLSCSVVVSKRRKNNFNTILGRIVGIISKLERVNISRQDVVKYLFNSSQNELISEDIGAEAGGGAEATGTSHNAVPVDVPVEVPMELPAEVPVEHAAVSGSPCPRYFRLVNKMAAAVLDSDLPAAVWSHTGKASAVKRSGNYLKEKDDTQKSSNFVQPVSSMSAAPSEIPLELTIRDRQEVPAASTISPTIPFPMPVVPCTGQEEQQTFDVLQFALKLQQSTVEDASLPTSPSTSPLALNVSVEQLQQLPTVKISLSVDTAQQLPSAPLSLQIPLVISLPSKSGESTASVLLLLDVTPTLPMQIKPNNSSPILQTIREPPITPVEIGTNIDIPLSTDDCLDNSTLVSAELPSLGGTQMKDGVNHFLEEQEASVASETPTGTLHVDNDLITADVTINPVELPILDEPQINEVIEDQLKVMDAIVVPTTPAPLTFVDNDVNLLTLDEGLYERGGNDGMCTDVITPHVAPESASSLPHGELNAPYSQQDISVLLERPVTMDDFDNAVALLTNAAKENLNDIQKESRNNLSMPVVPNTLTNANSGSIVQNQSKQSPKRSSKDEHDDSYQTLEAVMADVLVTNTYVENDLLRSVNETLISVELPTIQAQQGKEDTSVQLKDEMETIWAPMIPATLPNVRNAPNLWMDYIGANETRTSAKLPTIEEIDDFIEEQEMTDKLIAIDDFNNDKPWVTADLISVSPESLKPIINDDFNIPFNPKKKREDHLRPKTTMDNEMVLTHNTIRAKMPEPINQHRKEFKDLLKLQEMSADSKRPAPNPDIDHGCMSTIALTKKTDPEKRQTRGGRKDPLKLQEMSMVTKKPVPTPNFYDDDVFMITNDNIESAKPQQRELPTQDKQNRPRTQREIPSVSRIPPPVPGVGSQTMSTDGSTTKKKSKPVEPPYIQRYVPPRLRRTSVIPRKSPKTPVDYKVNKVDNISKNITPEAAQRSSTKVDKNEDIKQPVTPVVHQRPTMSNAQPTPRATATVEPRQQQPIPHIPLTVQPTFPPNFQPTFQSTFPPTFQPNIQTTFQPTFQPTVQPTVPPTVPSTVPPSMNFTLAARLQLAFQKHLFRSIMQRNLAQAVNVTQYTRYSMPPVVTSQQIPYQTTFNQHATSMPTSYQPPPTTSINQMPPGAQAATPITTPAEPNPYLNAFSAPDVSSEEPPEPPVQATTRYRSNHPLTPRPRTTYYRNTQEGPPQEPWKQMEPKLPVTLPTKSESKSCPVATCKPIPSASKYRSVPCQPPAPHFPAAPAKQESTTETRPVDPNSGMPPETSAQLFPPGSKTSVVSESVQRDNYSYQRMPLGPVGQQLYGATQTVTTEATRHNVHSHVPLQPQPPGPPGRPFGFLHPMIEALFRQSTTLSLAGQQMPTYNSPTITPGHQEFNHQTASGQIQYPQYQNMPSNTVGQLYPPSFNQQPPQQSTYNYQNSPWDNDGSRMGQPPNPSFNYQNVPTSNGQQQPQQPPFTYHNIPSMASVQRHQNSPFNYQNFPSVTHVSQPQNSPFNYQNLSSVAQGQQPPNTSFNNQNMSAMLEQQPPNPLLGQNMPPMRQAQNNYPMPPWHHQHAPTTSQCSAPAAEQLNVSSPPTTPQQPPTVQNQAKQSNPGRKRSEAKSPVPKPKK